MAELGPMPNPVSGTVKGQMARFSKNMVAAAELMPAEKFNFKPTPEMNTFGHLVMHIAQSNYGLCSKISGMAAPEVKTWRVPVKLRDAAPRLPRRMRIRR